MSVINEMLRDLDARMANERQAPSGLPRSLVAPKSPMSRWRLLIAVLMLVVVVMSAWFLLKPSDTLPEGVMTDAAGRSTSAIMSDASISNLEEAERAPIAPMDSKEAAQTKKVEYAENGRKQAEETSSAQGKPAQTQPAQAKSEQERALTVASSEPAQISTVQEKPELPTQTAIDAVSVKKEEAPSSQLASKKATSVQQPKKAEPVNQTLARADAETSSKSSSAGVVLTPKAQDQANALQAAEALKTGYDQNTIDSLYRYIAENEVDSLSRVVLARTLLSRQRLEETGALLAAVDGRSIVALREVKARWFAAQGKLSAALDVLNSARPPVKENLEYFALMASYYQQEGQFAEAVDTYSLLLEQNSDIADWWVGMAIGLDQMQRYNDAVLAYRQALALPNLKSSLASFSQSRLQQLTL
jgi:tetratricopeptide (TPR) repeat protein